MISDFMFEWDETKRLANLAKHNFNFADVGPAFIDPFRILCPVKGRSFIEDRWAVIGVIDGQAMHIVFTMRSGRIRLISARRAHEKERKLYET
jgi:uncharacterized DUF497 family protein